MRRTPRLALLLLVFLLPACAAHELAAARREAATIAAEGGLEPRLIAAPPFTLAAWQRPGEPAGGVLTVYLEGDGRDSHGPAFDRRMLRLAQLGAFAKVW